MLVAWVALAFSEPMDLRVVSSLLLTAQAWYSTVPKIPWINLMPSAYDMREVYSCSGFWMLALYMISQCCWVDRCGLCGADGHI